MARAASTSCSSTNRGASVNSSTVLNVALFGGVDLYRNGLQMTNPVVDLIGDRTGRIVPIYPQSEKVQLSTWELAGWVENALERCRTRGIADPLPDDIRKRLHLLDRGEALRSIHLPETLDAKDLARRRLAFDELLRVQLVLVRRKRAIEARSVGFRPRGRRRPRRTVSRRTALRPDGIAAPCRERDRHRPLVAAPDASPAPR